MDESSECLAHLVGIAQQPKERERNPKREKNRNRTYGNG